MTKNVSGFGNLPATGYVRLPQLLDVLPWSPATLWRKVKTKEFPSPVKLSARITAWEVNGVRAWLESKAKEGAAR